MCTLKEALTELENVDNTTKNKVENELVSIGSSAVPSLVDKLQVVRGIKRGVVAMTLIRIGDASVESGPDSVGMFAAIDFRCRARPDGVPLQESLDGNRVSHGMELCADVCVRPACCRHGFREGNFSYFCCAQQLIL